MKSCWLLLFCLLFTSCHKGESGIDDRSDVDRNRASFGLNETDLEKSRFCPASPIKSSADMKSGFRFDQQLIISKLTGEGLIGWMHAASPASGHFVFTYRSEKSEDEFAFFKAEEFSLVSLEEDIKVKLESLHRHDRVKLHGRMIPNGSPMRHLAISDIEVLEVYPLHHDYQPSVDSSIFKDLAEVRVLTKVHALIDGGKGMVLEYKDIVLPVVVDKSHLSISRGLYRGDKILVDLSILRREGRPLHFYTNPSRRGIRIVDAIRNCHGQKTTLYGNLVKFSRSPQINQDIFAVRVTDANGIIRNFTFFPDVDFAASGDDANRRFNELFAGISQKSKGAWEASTMNPKTERNHELQLNVRVEVNGTLNIVSKAQANPQIYISDLNDLVLKMEE